MKCGAQGSAPLPSMSLIDTHSRLRHALNSRIQRGNMSVTLLARKTQISKAHLSNYLHGKRNLSVASMSRILDALDLALEIFPKSKL